MEIAYGKVLLYLLTFIGYVYSGYGAGLLTNLRDAVLAAETVFGDVMQNILYIAKNFKNLHDVLDLAVEEHCIYKCPNGVPSRPNRNHVPTSDGCGSLGVNIDISYLPAPQMQKCCDEHDVCYDTCNSDKEVCDFEFKRCLYRYCDTHEKNVAGAAVTKACKAAAKVLFTGTITLGCRAFIDAQTKACYCPASKAGRSGKYASGGEL